MYKYRLVYVYSFARIQFMRICDMVNKSVIFIPTFIDQNNIFHLPYLLKMTVNRVILASAIYSF
jgi:hypothetical protein